MWIILSGVWAQVESCQTYLSTYPLGLFNSLDGTADNLVRDIYKYVVITLHWTMPSTLQLLQYLNIMLSIVYALKIKKPLCFQFCSNERSWMSLSAHIVYVPTISYYFYISMQCFACHTVGFFRPVCFLIQGQVLPVEGHVRSHNKSASKMDALVSVGFLLSGLCQLIVCCHF